MGAFVRRHFFEASSSCHPRLLVPWPGRHRTLVVGIYGVIAYVVTQRTREIGIRIALGTQTGDLRRLFLHHGLWLIGAGITIGIVVALALTRVTSALLFGVSPVDPATYAAVSLGLASVPPCITSRPCCGTASRHVSVSMRGWFLGYFTRGPVRQRCQPIRLAKCR
jgi:hypothetical protein